MRIVSQHRGAGDALAHHRGPLLLVKRRRAQRISFPWQPGRLLIVLSQPRRPHQPQAVTSPRRLQPNLTERLSPHLKSEDEQGTCWQALQACNVGIAFRRVPLKPTTKCGHRQSLSNDGELRGSHLHGNRPSSDHPTPIASALKSHRHSPQRHW